MGHNSHSSHGGHTGSGNGKQHKQKSQKSNTYDHSRSSKKTHASASSHRPLLSFLFVVNEVYINEDPAFGMNEDRWGTIIPPVIPEGFSREQAGNVFRYINGTVQLAQEYQWYRRSPREAGHIWGPGNNGQLNPLVPYSTYTVFQCWRRLPCIYINVDAMVHDVHANADRWWLMGFDSQETEQNTGITRISPDGGGSRYVTGRSPAWLGGIVPSTFRNPYEGSAHPPRESRGLGGPLPVIIAQMAMTHGQGATDTPFLQGMWHNREWRGPHHSYPIALPENLRGVLVHVAYDDRNPEGSNEETLRAFQWDDVILRN
ncbi:hypothetical protein F5Y15DRAFT_414483 [Xylariaceae sp. FL0016]|nr:hypothetical protein F5Y15DRAFT_414483 [Xylariaceae sp. FL0016]